MPDTNKNAPQKIMRFLELLFLFVAIPIAIAFLQNRALMLGILWATAVIVIVWLKLSIKRGFWEELNWAGVKSGYKWVLLRFAVIGPALFAFMALVNPEELLSFPRERPLIYLYVMIWYPLLSVVPQELLYKTLFFERYKILFCMPWVMIVASALFFGFMHIILVPNIFVLKAWLPVFMTTIAGLLMAHTYFRTRSLALVSLEHALYGCWAYTIGMGMYLHTGSVWAG